MLVCFTFHERNIEEGFIPITFLLMKNNIKPVKTLDTTICYKLLEIILCINPLIVCILILISTFRLVVSYDNKNLDILLLNDGLDVLK